MKEAVTRVIDTLTQVDFYGAPQKLLERYNKCIAARRDYFEGDKSFMYVLSIKVPIRKKFENLFNDPRIFYVFVFLLPLLNDIFQSHWLLESAFFLFHVRLDCQVSC